MYSLFLLAVCLVMHILHSPVQGAGSLGLGEGDCDYDSDCKSGFVCGLDNCNGPDFEWTDDCCEAGPSGKVGESCRNDADCPQFSECKAKSWAPKLCHCMEGYLVSGDGLYCLDPDSDVFCAPGMAIEMFNNKVIDNVETRDECVVLCKSETGQSGFKCNSVDYARYGKECKLSEKTRATAGDKYTDKYPEHDYCELLVIHPCDLNKGDCMQICMKEGDSAVCACEAEYTLNADQKNCDVIHPCDVNNGDCMQICIKEGDSAVCECEAGYTLKADQKNCHDAEAEVECIEKTKVYGANIRLADGKNHAFLQTQEECLDICDQNPSCASIEFNAASGKCQINSRALDEHDPRGIDSNWTYCPSRA